MQISALIRARFRFTADLARAADVARVLAKYALAGWLTDVEWAPVHDALKSQGGAVLAQEPFEARMRLALTDLGTTFIKLGQMLSTRPDLVGPALAAELTKLQEHVPPDAPEVAIRCVESELGRPIDECFAKFDGTALASASIGQVHQAKSKGGRRIVVKVQHPGIEGNVRRDLDILAFLAAVAEKNDNLLRYQPAALVREFSRTMLNELDFRRELRNLQNFRRNFGEDKTVVFPRPYPELTSGRVLTMDLVKGVRVTDAPRIDKLPVPREELARRGANTFIQMIFRDGFYHADPHPGNFLVLPDGTIALLDAGMVGRIDATLARQIEDVLLAAGDQDASALTDAVLRICGRPKELDRARLSADLTELFQEYGTQEVGHFNVSGALNAISAILFEHRLALPGRVSMLLKCLVLLEGTGKLLSPGFNLAELLAPWRSRVLMRRFSPASRIRILRRLFSDAERNAEILSRVVGTTLEQLDKGTYSLPLEHRRLKSAANRLVVGMFIAALLLGSTILMAAHVPPRLGDVSVLGVLGYLGAIVCGLRLMWVNRDSHLLRRDKDWD